MVACAPAAARNAAPIIDVLKNELHNGCTLLEIGSGTGLHASKAEQELPEVQWFATEIPDALPRLLECLEVAAPAAGRRAFAFDVRYPTPPAERYDAVFSCNTAHIMSLDSVACMFRQAGELTHDTSTFLLYGPFRVDGRYSSDSNAQFDAHLRSRDPDMGLRDLEHMDELAVAEGFERLRLYGMPSNNLMVVWRRRHEGPRVSQLSD